MNPTRKKGWYKETVASLKSCAHLVHEDKDGRMETLVLEIKILNLRNGSVQTTKSQARHNECGD